MNYCSRSTKSVQNIIIPELYFESICRELLCFTCTGVFNKEPSTDFEEFSSPFGFKTKIGSELANIFCILFDRLDEQVDHICWMWPTIGMQVRPIGSQC